MKTFLLRSPAISSSRDSKPKFTKFDSLRTETTSSIESLNGTPRLRLISGVDLPITCIEHHGPNRRLEPVKPPRKRNCSLCSSSCISRITCVELPLYSEVGINTITNPHLAEVVPSGRLRFGTISIPTLNRFLNLDSYNTTRGRKR